MKQYIAYPYSLMRTIVYAIGAYFGGLIAFIAVVVNFDDIRLRYLFLLLFSLLVIPWCLAKYTAKGKVSIAFSDDGFFLTWIKQITLRFQDDKEDRLIRFSEITDFRHGHHLFAGQYMRLVLADGSKFYLCGQLMPFVRATDFQELTSRLASGMAAPHQGPSAASYGGPAAAATPVAASSAKPAQKNSRGTRIALRLFVLYLVALTIITGSIMTFIVQPRKHVTAGVVVFKLVVTVLLIILSLISIRLVMLRLARYGTQIDERSEQG